jgi:ankyrin repeat protein
MIWPTPILAALYRHAFLEARTLAQGQELNPWEAAALGRVEGLERESGQEIDWAKAAPDGFTPLHLACYFGHPEAVLWLLERGVPLEPEGPGGLRPIHSAVASPDEGAALESTRALLARGANLHTLQRGGYSALHGAAQRGSLGLVRLLLEHGAQADLRTDAGFSAEDLARKAGHEGVVAWFHALA